MSWYSVSASPFFRCFVVLPRGGAVSLCRAWAQAFARVDAPRSPLVQKTFESSVQIQFLFQNPCLEAPSFSSISRSCQDQAGVAHLEGELPGEVPPAGRELCRPISRDSCLLTPGRGHLHVVLFFCWGGLDFPDFPFIWESRTFPGVRFLVCELVAIVLVLSLAYLTLVRFASGWRSYYRICGIDQSGADAWGCMTSLIHCACTVENDWGSHRGERASVSPSLPRT